MSGGGAKLVTWARTDRAAPPPRTSVVSMSEIIGRFINEEFSQSAARLTSLFARVGVVECAVLSASSFSETRAKSAETADATTPRELRLTTDQHYRLRISPQEIESNVYCCKL